MTAIGFATKFYTLWDYTVEKVYFTDCNGKHHLSGHRHVYHYIKNISQNLDKVKEMYPDIEPNHELFGRNSYWEKTETIDFTDTQFPYGNYRGTEIMECNDTFQLRRCLEDQHKVGARRRVLARRRLIELGELVRYHHLKVITSNYNGYDEGRPIISCVAVRKYATPRDVENFEKIKAEELRKAQTVFLHQDGEKVELDLKLVDRFSFPTQFGLCFIATYKDKADNVYKYKGSSPPNIENDDFYHVKCTIKHNDYRGEKQTLIQRVKIIS